MSKCKSIKRLFPATFAWMLLLVSTLMFFIFPCRRLQDEFHYSITIFQAIVTFFVISNFFHTTFLDPGIIKRANPDEDKDDFGAPLFKEVQVNGTFIRMKWCPTCQFYRPPRCSHCSVCNNCIETFDHHCPWVNNCIGRRNYRHFFFFLICLTLHMITIFIWCLLLVLNHKDNLNETSVIVAILLMIIISIMFIPILGLTIFHIVLVARGRTTNEQVTGKFDLTNNPFSQGIFMNCLYTLCGPRYPSVNHIRPKDVGINELDVRARVYQDDIPLDVQSNTHDIQLQRLDKRESVQDSFNSAHHSHSNERLSNQQSQAPVNLPQQLESDINGLNRTEGSRHVVTMHQTKNGTKETTFVALSSPMTTTAVKISSERPGMFSYYNNKISASPSKSTSTNEIATHFQRSPFKRNESQGPEGGMVIYYSPDAGVNSKFDSDGEMQKLKTSLLDPTANEYYDSRLPNTSGYECGEKLLKKPMPFLKALEMSNQMEQSAFQLSQPGSSKHSDHSAPSQQHTDKRQSQYEMNYEISV